MNKTFFLLKQKLKNIFFSIILIIGYPIKLPWELIDMAR